MTKRDNLTGKLERRTIRTEVRAAKSDGEARHIEGYASMFGQPYSINDWWAEFVEIIDPHAFDRCLAENPDVRCLFNHDPNWILGRTKSNTLTLKADDKGLHYDCTPASGPLVSHVTDSIERGDVDGSSFGFQVLKDSWVDETDENGRLIKSTRTILDAEIYDVSPVVFPANEGTSAGIRSQMFPNGMPAEVRSRYEKRNQWCKCTCDECAAGNCAECSDPDCTDANCEGERDEQNDRGQKPPANREQRAAKCQCDCQDCQGGNCDGCTDDECEDDNCRCNMRARRQLTAEQRGHLDALVSSGVKVKIEARADAKTKKVDGVDLTSDCFAYVGDADKTRSWKLPIQFPGDEEKTKTHIGNALTRLDSTKGIPEAERSAVRQKIVAAAKTHNIAVPGEPDNTDQTEIEMRQRSLRLLEAELG